MYSVASVLDFVECVIGASVWYALADLYMLVYTSYFSKIHNIIN